MMKKLLNYSLYSKWGVTWTALQMTVLALVGGWSLFVPRLLFGGIGLMLVLGVCGDLLTMSIAPNTSKYRIAKIWGAVQLFIVFLLMVASGFAFDMFK